MDDHIDPPIEFQLERAMRDRDEAMVDLAHIARLLGESDAKRFELEKLVTRLHNKFWGQLHESDRYGGVCPICALGVPE